MNLPITLAWVALVIGTINIVLALVGIFLGGGRELVSYGVLCVVLVTLEAMYIDYKRLGYVPDPFGGSSK